MGEAAPGREISYSGAGVRSGVWEGHGLWSQTDFDLTLTLGLLLRCSVTGHFS